MTDNWIIDASPLILLGKAGQLDWLTEMGRIIVPESVASEVAAGSPTDPARQWLEASQGATCIVRDVALTSDLLAWDLGMGEIAVIAMIRSHWLLSDPGADLVEQPQHDEHDGHHPEQVEEHPCQGQRDAQHDPQDDKEYG